MAFFWLLCLLSLNICQAAGNANSTQVYYTKMTVDNNALDVIKKILMGFQWNDGNKIITELHMTTRCVKEGNTKTCNCSKGYKWSDQVIQSNKDSCYDSVCTLPINSDHTCISEKTVKVSGSITLKEDTSYAKCLLPPGLEYNLCKKEVEDALKSVYSTLKGLDTFTIKGFRPGSVIVDFELTVVDGITADTLFDTSQKVDISKTMTLETTGMVTVTVPNEKVLYNENAMVNCTTVEDLQLDPTWTLRRDGLSFDITDGTVSKLMTNNPKEFQITLTKVDKHWTGEYDCSFTKSISNITVTYKANATIDICLKPDIINSVEPAFPLCTRTDQLLFVTVTCQIMKSSESYNVTWPEDYIINPTTNDSNMLTYSAQKLINCADEKDVEGACNFTNRCNQTQRSSFNINVIGVNEAYCKQDNDWQNTKAGFTATLKCQGKAGVRRRECGKDGNWKEEVSECVVVSLKNVLEKASIANSGLGNVDKNAADVLRNFSVLTKTEDLNTRANINASVSVYSTLKGMIGTINNATTVENFLDSSNNLLNRTLNNSWISNVPSYSQTENGSLAEEYLLSVEDLIKKSNISTNSERKNMVVKNCTNKTCDGLFNNSVSLHANVSGDIKTVAFKNLQDYLPQNDSKHIINSLVMSTVADVTGDVTIVIEFDLQNQRPRDTELICVYWNNNSHSWSKDGCAWKGPSAEGQCVCNHLSSFAVLMSKTPLRVPALSILTTVGLSISIMSLIINLAIEMIVWQQVVKTNTLYLRHAAQVNISVCLLVADICFLASSKPDDAESHGQTSVWCRIFAVLKHFFYLAMFFWMLALSSTLLHQAVFLFHKVSKKTYLRFSILLGYVCPLLIVFITFLANNAGEEGSYFLSDTCWLVYNGLLKGSIFTFIIPVGIIVFFNTFSMLVVIMKLLEHHKNDDTQIDKEKAAAKTVIRSVVLLTPIFGLTWAFGLMIMILDLTSGTVAYAVNYIFVILNAFQGFFILLTCLKDKMIREALLTRFKKRNVTPISTSTVKTETSWKK